ncbi:Uncharacterized protein Adt_35925 [Abeliophyllum distichum]|uniref:Uncharacterized protein n=1 Tax=Abeliophyllum distichum TaxID=126358 RepID=A0ABD1QG39_9LAMI
MNRALTKQEDNPSFDSLIPLCLRFLQVCFLRERWRVIESKCLNGGEFLCLNQLQKLRRRNEGGAWKAGTGKEGYVGDLEFGKSENYGVERGPLRFGPLCWA